MGDRQALVGPRCCSLRVVLGAGRHSLRVVVGAGHHSLRVVVGTGRHSLRVLLVAGGGGYWFIIAWALSLAMFVSSSWVVVVVALWWGCGLVLCFIIVLCQLPRGWLPSSRVASSSVMVIVLE